MLKLLIGTVAVHSNLLSPKACVLGEVRSWQPLPSNATNESSIDQNTLFEQQRLTVGVRNAGCM